ncbi:MAG: hypothetical protein V4481_02220 [Patescibacteria group bacterium]
MISNFSTKTYLWALGAALVVIAFFVAGAVIPHKIEQTAQTQEYLDNVATIASAIRSPFEYTFNVDGILAESGTSFESISPYWWVDSGGLLLIHSGTGSTIQGDLPQNNRWRMAYAGSNPTDTDDGLHPQNIFRLLTRSQWHNFRQEMYFRINKTNLSSSPNRNESNGLLLFNRYTDSADLYYAGIRVDGHAVIKKKLKGTYYTLAEASIFPGAYDRANTPNLLPQNKWIGLRSEVTTLGADHVKIRLYVDEGEKNEWKLVADADDFAADVPVIDERGYAGVRTDFMDVDFKGFKIEEL